GIPDLMIYTEKVKNKGEYLENVFIQMNTAEKGEKVIFARRGKLRKIGTPPLKVTALRMELLDGNIVEFVPKKKRLEKILFQRHDFLVSHVQTAQSDELKASSMTGGELWKTLNLPKQEKLAMGYDEEEQSKISFEFWNRVNTP